MVVREAEKPIGVCVVVHGANEYSSRYQWLINELVQAQFHVVYGDLPGHGVSPKHRGHIDSFNEYVETIEGWYNTAANFKLPIFLIGHSMGGLATIETMLQKNLAVKAIILSSPCLGLVNEPPKFQHYGASLINKISPKLKLSSNLPPRSGTRCPEMHKRDEQDEFLNKKVSVRWYLELVKTIKGAQERPGQFPDRPLLLLQAGEDLIVDKEAVKRWFNNINISEKYWKEWPGLYHEVFNEPEKEDVFRVAKAFLTLQLEE